MGVVGAEQFESVVSTDERVAVPRPWTFPWSAICHVEARFPSGLSLSGTGALIGPSHLLTAAHCVHDFRLGGSADHIRVSPGRYGDRTVAPVVLSADVLVPVPWRRMQAPWADMAVVVLQEAIGQATGWFRIRAVGDGRLRRQLVNVAGYPLDRPADDMTRRGKVMYWAVGRVVRVTTGRLWHLADTYYGQSGAPLWLFRSPDRRYLVAVHTMGARTENAGVRINRRVGRFLRELLRGRPQRFVSWQ